MRSVREGTHYCAAKRLSIARDQQASAFFSLVVEVDLSETILVVVVFFFFLYWQTSAVVFSRQFVRESETMQMLFFSLR